MLDVLEENPLKHKTLKGFWIIQTFNDQQRKMYNEKANRCIDRILSIDQPYVSPIVTDKRERKLNLELNWG